jgi:hypothetical protein
VLRTIQEAFLAEMASKFGYSTPLDSTRVGNPPRDVLWCPPELAFRLRAEQSSELERPVEENFPFMSFWRTAVSPDLNRANLPQMWDGVPTDTTRATRYTLRPVRIVLQAEHWSSDHEVHEAAIENYFKWTMPVPELVVTDSNGVVFQLPMWVIDPQDNSRIPELFEVGEIYRETFTFAIGGYVVESTGGYKPIETIKWDIWDYSATGEIADAVRIKQVELTE